MSQPADFRSSSVTHPPAASSSTQRSGQPNGPLSYGEASSRVGEGGHKPGQANGDGSSSKREKRHESSSPGPVGTAQEQEQGQGIKIQKTRKAGGFLLPSALRHSSDVRQHKSQNKGKGKADIERSSSLRPLAAYNAGRTNGSMRSSPLAQVVVSPRPSYADGHYSRMSTEVSSSARSDANSSRDAYSGEYNEDGSSEFGQDAAYRQQSTGIDPAQIVNMALNLSESRRRNFSAGQLLPQSSAGVRRAVSATVPAPGPFLQGSYQTYGAGGSLRQHLQQARRISRNQSPGSGKKTPNPRQASTSYATPSHGDSTGASQPGYHFSDATLARAEKARLHIELFVEFRRLLQHLPALQSDSAVAGNFVLSTSSVPGSTNVQLHREISSVPNQKHPLGRGYNPLQLIRNRKARARARSPLNPDIEHWNDSATVRGWIDAVEDESQHPTYRSQDKVALPPYPLGGSVLPVPDSSDHLGHRRNDSSISRTKRPRLDWFTSPAEHLADAYWMEQDDNKKLVENRNGNRIFPSTPSTESLRPRFSYESRRSQQGSVATSVGSFEIEESGHESPRDDYRGRRRRLHHNRDDSKGRLKQVWHKARRRSRSSSSGLSSSDDGSGASDKRPKIGVMPPDMDNVGPLERVMNDMLNAESASSPTLISPGTPNKWGTDLMQTPLLRDQMPPEAEEGNKPPLGSEIDVQDFVQEPERGVGAVKHSKRPSRILEDPDELRSSFEEDLDSTNPNSPTGLSFIPSIGLELSPVGSRATSPARKSRKGILPFIRSDGNRDSRKLDVSGSLYDDSDNKSSRHTSAEVPSKPRSSLEVASSPSHGKHLFSHKKNESFSSLSQRPSSRGKDSKEGHEPKSAVRRFFKGGRIGEIVRHEGAKVGGYMRKRDSPQDPVDEFSHTDTESLDESDTEDTESRRSLKERPHPLQRTTSSTLGERSIRKPRYHIDNLPSFRSANAQKSLSGPPTPSGHDHISKQQRALKDNRSSRFDRLAPPNLDLAHVSSHSSTSLSRTNTYTTANSSGQDRRSSYGFPSLNRDRNRSRHDNRLKAILDVPGGVGRGGLPASALTDVSKERKGSRPSLMDKRHWSISDKPRTRSLHPHANAVTRADIARIRALLLCSGIKAAEISRRAQRPRNPPPSFLVRAAEISKASLISVPRKEEHVLAARMLTTSLEDETAALHADAGLFRDKTVNELRKELDEVRDLVESCVERARNEGDESVRFGAEITGQRTIEVRRVVDALEKLARARRRRLRWLRRVGFGLVEWGLVLFMWWIWLIVVIFRMIWRVFRGLGLAVRWVLWL